ncbi:MAG: hypothetical protein JWO30_141 [Fibrobacteres bacterium]|nr:hypothetical protein [Fibrobacterota bacterium]
MTPEQKGRQKARERMDTMKHYKLTLSLQTLALAGAASLLLTGCLTNKENDSFASDGQSAYMASEVDQMGQVYDQISPDAAAKTSAFGGFTITGEKVIEPFKYDSSCTCFIRHATYSNIEGFERDRLDSVTLLDSTGATMNVFNKAVVSKIIHKRNVVKTKGSREADIRFDITVDIKTDAGVRKGEWNGTMTGSYNNQEFKSGTITKVVRVWEDGRFHFPESGTVEIDRPVFHFLVEFLGDSAGSRSLTAKVTITNKVNNKIHILWVDKDYNETEPVEAP